MIDIREIVLSIPPLVLLMMTVSGEMREKREREIIEIEGRERVVVEDNQARRAFVGTNLDIYDISPDGHKLTLSDDSPVLPTIKGSSPYSLCILSSELRGCYKTKSEVTETDVVYRKGITVNRTTNTIENDGYRVLSPNEWGQYLPEIDKYQICTLEVDYDYRQQIVCHQQ